MNKRTGFTLIELLVVIAIISVLMAAVRPMLTASASQTREFECQSHLKQIGMALHAYSEDYGAFPDRLDRVDSILQDRSVLQCSKTSREYYYQQPPESADRDTVVASCIDPHKVRSGWPHRYGKCYLALSAGGGVKKVCRR